MQLYPFLKSVKAIGKIYLGLFGFIPLGYLDESGCIKWINIDNIGMDFNAGLYFTIVSVMNDDTVHEESYTITIASDPKDAYSVNVYVSQLILRTFTSSMEQSRKVLELQIPIETFLKDHIYGKAIAIAYWRYKQRESERYDERIGQNGNEEIPSYNSCLDQLFNGIFYSGNGIKGD